MAATLPTNIAVQTTGHPGLHNAVNAAVNEHDGRITSLEGRATALEGVASIVGAGRPDIPASMTTAVQAQVAAAPVGAIFSSTDGASVGAWQWQKLPDGWIVSYGNTGWCDLTGKLSNGATATTVAWKRNMSGECVRLLNAVLPTGTFLSGFSEIFPVYWGLVPRNGGYNVIKSTNGGMYCPEAFTTGTENLYFNIPTVRKSSWVTVLPGPVIP